MAGIHEHTVIDLVATNPAGGALLVMVEDRPWSDHAAQLADLREKLANYTTFVIDGQMFELYPDLAELPVSLELRSAEEPPAEARAAVAKAERSINEALRETPPSDLVELATQLLADTIRRLKPADTGFAPYVVAVAPAGQRELTRFPAETLEQGVRDAWAFVEGLTESHQAAIVFDGFLTVADERLPSAFAYVATTGADRSFRFAQGYVTQRGLMKRVVARGPVTLISADEPLVRIAG